MTQFLITALGSYGDVHPMVGLGATLVRRGHRVKLVANPYFEHVLDGTGIEFAPIGTREEYVQLSQHPDLWHPIRGPKLVLTHAATNLRMLYDHIMLLHSPGETVFCAHPLDFASRIVAEAEQAPIASVDLAPGMMWTLHDSPRLSGAMMGPRVPKWLKRMQFYMSDTLFVKPLLGKPINMLRAERGLPPAARIFSFWMHDTDMVLGLFPEWFGPPQPDWPQNVRLAGFPLWDSHAADELSPEVREFLAAGSPPIAFSPGSANKEAHKFFAAAVDACERLGARGILLTKYDHQLPPNMPASVRHFGFVPLSKLLPHTAALVHHGGIGNCAQGLAAGVPQLVQPMSYDQFDNSRRLERLGVSREVSVRNFRGRDIAEALAKLLDSPSVAATCQQLAARCDGPRSLQTACEALEELAATRTGG